jgi:hypothetical protein
MHAIALQVTSEDPSVRTHISRAIEAIEAERMCTKELFTGPYERPKSTQCLALLLRCSELYLEDGTWYELSHAEARLIENGHGRLLHDIRNVFKGTDQTDRSTIESPVIELPITRYELVKHFEEKPNL